MAIKISDEEVEFLGNMYLKIKQTENKIMHPGTFEQFVNRYIDDKINWLQQFYIKRKEKLCIR